MVLLSTISTTLIQKIASQQAASDVCLVQEPGQRHNELATVFVYVPESLTLDVVGYVVAHNAVTDVCRG